MSAVVLSHLRAMAHPAGNRIDLTWDAPAEVEVLVVRGEREYPPTFAPASLREGVRVPTEEPGRAVDRDLPGDRAYYYSFFTKQPGGNFEAHEANRCTVYCTSPRGWSASLYAALPALYRRYDDKTTPIGTLAKFLDLPGGLLDQLESEASAIPEQRVARAAQGATLPRLAHAIGWKTNRRLGISEQREEIRTAPAMYRNTGRMPAVETIIKRFTGWESRVRELGQNVFVSNQIPRFNIWRRSLQADGTWSLPGDEPLSFDFAYSDGTLAAAQTDDGAVSLFYHTRRRNRWTIWRKRRLGDGSWAPADPVEIQGRLERYPTAIARRITPDRVEEIVFWTSEDPQSGRRELRVRHWDGARWQPAVHFNDLERQRPVLTRVGEAIYVFYQEKQANVWRWMYALYAANSADAAVGSRLQMPQPLPAFTRQIAGDLAAVFTPTENHIRLLWTTITGGRKRLATCSASRGANGNLSFSADAALFADELADDSEADRIDQCDPALLLTASGELEVYFASNRNQNWSVFRRPLTSTSPAREISGLAFQQRRPLAIRDGALTTLFYRGDDPVEYRSPRYPATHSLDARYSGSITGDPRDLYRSSQRNAYGDYQRYSLGVASGGLRYSFEAIGIYLTPASGEADLVARNQKLIAEALRAFLPVNVRPFLIIENPPTEEHVYGYAAPDRSNAYIIDLYADELREYPRETISRTRERRRDQIPEWEQMRAPATGESPENMDYAIDYSDTPIDPRSHSWHVDLDRWIEGERENPEPEN